MNCSRHKGNQLAFTNIEDSINMKTHVSSKTDSLVEDGNDCVFNSDYKGLTTEWLTKIGKNDFNWRADLNQAFIPLEQDTIYLAKGGCEHFGVVLELRLGDDNHTITDSAFWMNKALSLATEFGLEHYKKMIGERRIRKVENSKNVVWFEIEDDDLDDNLYYNGVEINFERKSKVISISQYYN